MTRRRKIILICVPVAIAMLILTSFACRYRANVRLGRELRKEADAWLATLPTIPDAENGAPVIIKALEQFDDFYETFNDSNPSIDSEVVVATLRVYLSQKKEAFDLLEKGLAYKNWMYIRDYHKGNHMTIPNSLAARNAGKVYCLKGDIAQQEGRKTDALNEYLTAIRLGKTFSRERQVATLFCGYVGMADMGFKRILKINTELLFGQEELSNTLEILLDVHESQANPILVCETEYYYFIMAMTDILTGVSISRGFNITPIKDEPLPWWMWYTYDFEQDVEIFRKWLDLARVVDPPKYYKLPVELRKSGAMLRKIGLPDGTSIYIPAIDLHVKRGADAIFAQIAVFSLPGFVKSLALLETVFRGTMVLVAIRLHQAKNGSLPESLDALGEFVPKDLLIDPFSGKNLVYRREGDDFYLYSVGFNGVDDKCKDSKPVYEKDVDIDEIPDIIFHAPADGK